MKEQNENGLRGFGRKVIKYRIPIILFWFVSVALFGMLALKLPDQLTGSGLDMDNEFTEVQNVLQEDFDLSKSSLIILFNSNQYEPTEKIFKQYVEETLSDISKVETVTSITSPYENKNMIKDGMSFAIVGFEKGFSELSDEIEIIQKELANDTNEGIQASLTGNPVIMEDLISTSKEDVKRSEMIGIPIALLILVIAFGTIVSSLIPLIIGLTTVSISFGIMYLLSFHFDLSIFVLNVVPMIGLALGIDFSLLLVSRFKEELETNSVNESVLKMVEHASHAVLPSGLLVLIGLSTMFYFKIDTFFSLALGSFVVVTLSILCAFTLLPALLSILGYRVNNFKVLKVRNREAFWYKLAEKVMKRPVVMLVVTLFIVLLFAYPIKDIQLVVSEEDSIPKSYDSRIALEQFKEKFSSDAIPAAMLVVSSEEDLLTEESLSKLEDYIKEIKENELVNRIESVFSVTETNAEELDSMYQNEQTKSLVLPAIDQLFQNNHTVIKVFLNESSSSEEAKDWVGGLERQYGEFTIKVGGEAKYYQEIFHEILSKIPVVITLIIISTFIILTITFKSIMIPLKAILMNALSISASIGIMVLIFQKSDITDSFGINIVTIVFIFCLVFCLSQDFECFLIARVYEIYIKTNDNDYATLHGLAKTSKVISSAGLIMIVITGSFVISGVVPVKQMGLGIALAILIDITLIRMLAIPSLLKLMGHWNWWLPFRKVG